MFDNICVCSWFCGALQLWRRMGRWNCWQMCQKNTKIPSDGDRGLLKSTSDVIARPRSTDPRCRRNLLQFSLSRSSRWLGASIHKAHSVRREEKHGGTHLPPPPPAYFFARIGETRSRVQWLSNKVSSIGWRSRYHRKMLDP